MVVNRRWAKVPFGNLPSAMQIPIDNHGPLL
jgi:hypothetical protein